MHFGESSSTYSWITQEHGSAAQPAGHGVIHKLLTQRSSCPEVIQSPPTPVLQGISPEKRVTKEILSHKLNSWSHLKLCLLQLFLCRCWSTSHPPCPGCSPVAAFLWSATLAHALIAPDKPPLLPPRPGSLFSALAPRGVWLRLCALSHPPGSNTQMLGYLWPLWCSLAGHQGALCLFRAACWGYLGWVSQCHQKGRDRKQNWSESRLY